MSEDNGLSRGWAWTTLGVVGKWRGGGTPSKATERFWVDGEVPWVSPKDMKVLKIADTEDHISSSAVAQTNVKPVPAGTILVVVRSGILERTLPVGVAQVPVTMNQDLKGISPSGSIDPMYVAYYLIGSERDVLSRCSKDGTTVASIDSESLKAYPIPLAPLTEQRRIVAAIEQQFTRLDAGVTALRSAQTRLKRYRTAVLKAAVEGKLTEEWRAEHTATEPAPELLARILAGRRARWEADLRAKGKDPAKARYQESAAPDTAGLPELPEAWCWATLPQLGELARGKSKHRPRDDKRLFGGCYPFVQTGEVRRAAGTITSYSETYSDFGLAQSRLWPKGTLCITIAANIADSAILGFDACFPDSVVGFITKENHCNARFVEYFIRTAKENLERFAPATAQKNINLDTLQQLAIALPPFAEQEQIVAEVERRLSVVDELGATVEANLKRAERLRKSILREAFAGRLVPQDPTDEPASALLERIRREHGANTTGAGRNGRARSAVGVDHDGPVSEHVNGIAVRQLPLLPDGAGVPDDDPRRGRAR